MKTEQQRDRRANSRLAAATHVNHRTISSLRLLDVHPRRKFSRALPAVDTEIEMTGTDDRQFRVGTGDYRMRFRLQLRERHSGRVFLIAPPVTAQKSGGPPHSTVAAKDH